MTRQRTPSATTGEVRAGIEVLLRGDVQLLSKRRIGLITNQTGVDRRLASTVDLVHARGDLELTALFAPEHGVRGELQAGEPVAAAVDRATGLPVHSLFGETPQPTPEMLAGLDALVFDIQDAGVRFFTYISTMGHAMEAAAEHGLEFVVLDRPNPLGGSQLGGNVLDPAFASFVGRYPIALRHAMTVGELAQMFNAEFGIGADLRVVPMTGWRRRMRFEDTGLPWVHPGPNVALLAVIETYPGVCFLEGTNVSEGRGTTRAFQIGGAPWMDALELAAYLNERDVPGAHYRPTYFVPTFSKHQGTLCAGVEVHPMDRATFEPVRAGLELVAAAKQLYPERFEWRVDAGGRYFFDRLAGTDDVRLRLERGQAVADIVGSWRDEISAFDARRHQYLLYD